MAGRRRPLLPIILIVVALAVVAAVVWLVAFRDDDDSGSSASNTTSTTPQTAPPTTAGALDDEGTELADLLASSREATFHATYEATQPPETEGGPATSYTIELYRSEGRTRQDTVTALEGGEYRTAGILVDGRSILCTKQGTAEWVCSQAAAAEDSAADGIFGTIVRSLGNADVNVTEDVIDGRDVRCFVYETADGAGSMCVTPDGIPVTVTSGETSMVLTALEDEVDDDVFSPPAEPVQAEE